MSLAINHPSRAAQLICFDGLEFGKVHPSDIDMVIDLHGKGWCVCEIKGVGVPLPRGQRILMEQIAKDCRRNHKICLMMVAEHHEEDPSKQILAKDCTVREYMTDKVGWKQIGFKATVQKMLNAFVAKSGVDL